MSQRAAGLRPQVCPEHSTVVYKAVSVWAPLDDFPPEAEGASARQRRQTLRDGPAQAGRLGKGNSGPRLRPVGADLDHPGILEVTVDFQVFWGARL
jgi:hypothetical protein